MTARRVFPGWSICIPRSFRVDFQEEDAYWHAWDAHRSVSLTSFLMVGEDGPVRREELAEVLSPLVDGDPQDLPPGLGGWASNGPAIQPARASQAISAMLAADGRVLLVTITHDDLGWARKVLASIHHHPVPLTADIEGVKAAQVQ